MGWVNEKPSTEEMINKLLLGTYERRAVWHWAADWGNLE
jgi:hypothetical protein